MVKKIIAYESSPTDLSRGAVLVADRTFENMSSSLQTLLPSDLPTQLVNRSSDTDSVIHDQIISAINRGPLFVNYVGHGSTGVWTGARLLSNADAPLLTNSDRLSFFAMMTCMNGYFQDAANDSLAESMLRSSGGAVATWASSGLTEPSAQALVDAELYRQIFSDQHVRLGDAIRTAKLTTSDNDIRRTWTLLGDPALNLVTTASSEPTLTLSGTVLDRNGQSLAGVTIRLTGGAARETITDANGRYSFAGIQNGADYTVTASLVNYSFSPASRSYAQAANRVDAIFVGTPNGGALNPLDTDAFFVRQYYVDFLNREPDESGFNFWTNEIAACGTDDRCREVKRINTSAAYFLSIEFQETGFEVYRMYKAAYGDLPNAPVPLRFAEFTTDTHDISNGVIVGRTNWQATLEANKATFAQEFVQRSRFTTQYPTSMSPAEFVDALFASAGVTPSSDEKTAATNEFAGAADSIDGAARARALRRVAENPRLTRQEFNRAFVLMEYFGYLRRDPNSGPDIDFSGYKFWLDKLNSFNGNFIDAEMVKAFLSSPEYRRRFGN
jgi:Peptidase family C25/Carboxypeptidase regulatory-like domain